MLILYQAIKKENAIIVVNGIQLHDESTKPESLSFQLVLTFPISKTDFSENTFILLFTFKRYDIPCGNFKYQV